LDFCCSGAAGKRWGPISLSVDEDSAAISGNFITGKGVSRNSRLNLSVTFSLFLTGKAREIPVLSRYATFYRIDGDQILFLAVMVAW
jgi:hypothetical protein